MQLIRNAITYKATLPSAVALAEHLAEKPFVPVLETQASASGFVPVQDDRLVAEFPGGFAFRLRSDVKPISIKALRLAQFEALEAKAAELERELTDEEAGAIKDELYTNTVKNTLPERSELNAYYHIESTTLIVPTTNKVVACRMVSMLIEACGALETRTIWVSDVKGGLTARLKRYYGAHTDGEYCDRTAFEGFKVGDSIALTGEKGAKASFDLENLDHAQKGLVEALNAGMEVPRLELVHADAVSFVLTKDFHLRKIDFLLSGLEDETPDFDTTEELWRHSAGVQVLQLVATIQALCDLFGYQEPDEKAPDAEAAEAPAATEDLAEGEDPLLPDARHFVRTTRRASVAAVQRRLKIGYNRAARMIEAMEQEGLISPMDSHGHREVIGAEQ